MLYLIQYRNKAGRVQIGFVHGKNEQDALKQAVKQYGMFIISFKTGTR